MMAGAVVASANGAGTMRVFEAAVLNTKVLGAAASMVVVSFAVAEAMEVGMVGIAKGESLSN